MIDAPASTIAWACSICRGEGIKKSLFTPMKRNYDMVDLLAEVPNFPGKAVDVERGDSPLILAGEPIGPAPLVHGRQKGQPQAVDLHNCRGGGFEQIHAGPKVREPQFIEFASQLLESAVKTVKRMIVGQRKNVETRGCNRADKRRRADDARLGRDMSAVAGQSEFQIGKQHAALREDRADSRRNQSGITRIRNPIGAFAEQQVADGGQSNDLF